MHAATFELLGGIDGWHLLFLWDGDYYFFTLSFSLIMRYNVKNYEVHYSMHNVSEKIYKTCKAYLKKQGKFLIFFISSYF